MRRSVPVPLPVPKAESSARPLAGLAKLLLAVSARRAAAGRGVQLPAETPAERGKAAESGDNRRRGGGTS
jgi:hypothetical protein